MKHSEKLPKGTLTYDQLSEPGIFSGSCRRVKLYPRCQTPLYLPAVISNHISNLEKEFDVVLFNRTSPLTLTYAGQALQTRARQLLDLKDETYKEISDIKDFSTSFLLVFSHTRGRLSFLRSFLPIKGISGIELHLVEGNSSELANDLLHGNIDLTIDLLPFYSGKCSYCTHLPGRSF